jgi:hypothetical protein
VVVGLVIGLGAWVVGPGQLARAVRRGGSWLVVSARAGAARLGWRPGVVDRWVGAHVAALRAGVVVLIVGVYALWTRPTGTVVVWLALALVALLAIIEFFRRGAALPATVDPLSAAVDADAPTLPVVQDPTPSPL